MHMEKGDGTGRWDMHIKRRKGNPRNRKPA